MKWHFRSENFHEDEDPDFLTVKHYLLYWKVAPDVRDEIDKHLTTAYAASNYLKRVKPGDVLWIVNVHQYQLYLLGRLKVEYVIDDTQIAQDLASTNEDVWHEADWYAISNQNDLEPMRNLNISHLAEYLRFDSSASEMLDLHDGRIDALQLQTLRLLARQSAQLLDDVWYNEAYSPESVQDFLELTEDDSAYNEGKVVFRTVKQRQRSRQLVNTAKREFQAKNDGRLYCEVCGFDFSAIYGVDYIEVHHTQPLSSLDEETENTIEAVIMICANCHRIAHSRTPPYTVDELKEMIKLDLGN